MCSLSQTRCLETSQSNDSCPGRYCKNYAHIIHILLQPGGWRHMWVHVCVCACSSDFCVQCVCCTQGNYLPRPILFAPGMREQGVESRLKGNQTCNIVLFKGSLCDKEVWWPDRKSWWKADLFFCPWPYVKVTVEDCLRTRAQPAGIAQTCHCYITPRWHTV